MRICRWAVVFTAGLLVLDVVPAQEKKANPGTPGLRFSERLIADKFVYAYGLATADLDGDGDLDLTSQDVFGQDMDGKKVTLSSLYWFENDGGGTFQRHVIHKDEPGWFERHAVGDINGDGKPDVAIVNNRDGHIIWFANRDQPSAGPWKRFVITTKSPRVYDVILADLDGDGDLDAADAGYANGEFNWYANPGKDGHEQEWTRRLVGDKMPEARTVGVGDFNGDGKIDLLGAAAGIEKVPADVTDVNIHFSSVAWYENPGQLGASASEALWKKHVIDNRARAAIHGHPVDLDGDGDLDVMMAHGHRKDLVAEDRHEVVWYENSGKPAKGSEWKRHKIGPLPYAFEAVSGDMDGDGDIDVVATAWFQGDRVVWFENPGDPRGPWVMHLVRKDWNAANQVIVADLNGDKRPDIAAVADNGSVRINYKGANEMRWWRNDGPAK